MPFPDLLRVRALAGVIGLVPAAYVFLQIMQALVRGPLEAGGAVMKQEDAEEGERRPWGC